VHTFPESGRRHYGTGLHRSATTTEAIRRAIQHSQESLRVMARRHGINPKTVATWRRRDCTADRRTGPSVPKSTVLSVEQEAVIVAFRKHTLLPLDDCLYALQAHDSSVDPIFVASLPRTPWHQPSARGGRRQAQEEEVRQLSDRLLPHRSGRGAHRRGQTLPLRGHRSNFQVRCGRTRGKG
jgi:hypothetical protein